MSRKAESPNRKIDQAIDKLMAKLEDAPLDMSVKIIKTAIDWEKVKHHVTDDQEDFDPDAL